MSIKLPKKCLNKDYKPYCTPISQIKSDGNPFSFICIGLNDGTDRQYEQDYLTKCVSLRKEVDLCHCDERDLIDELSVIGNALSVIANMKENELNESN